MCRSMSTQSLEATSAGRWPGRGLGTGLSRDRDGEPESVGFNDLGATSSLGDRLVASGYRVREN